MKVEKKIAKLEIEFDFILDYLIEFMPYERGKTHEIRTKKNGSFEDFDIIKLDSGEDLRRTYINYGLKTDCNFDYFPNYHDLEDRIASITQFYVSNEGVNIFITNTIVEDFIINQTKNN